MRKFSNIYNKAKWIAEHAFLASLFLLLTALILGGIVFYKYSTLIQRLEPEIDVAPVQFQKHIYQDILEEWRLREEKFESVGHKEYPDLFWID